MHNDFAASTQRAIDLTISVPVHSSLSLHTVNDGDISVSNVDGELDVNDVNGEVTLSSISGTVVAHALNGKVLGKIADVNELPVVNFIVVRIHHRGHRGKSITEFGFLCVLCG